MDEASPSAAAPPRRASRKERRRTHVLGWVAVGLYMAFMMCADDLFFPNQPGVDARKMVEDRAAAKAVAEALLKYRAESGGWFPAAEGATPLADGDQDTDTSAAAGVVAALLGKGPAAEAGKGTAGKNFLEGFRAAKADAAIAGGWKYGLVSAPPRYSIVDHYGRCFRVRLDTGENGQVEHPNVPTESAKASGFSPWIDERVAVWTAGKDGDFSTWSDNVGSWQQ